MKCLAFLFTLFFIGCSNVTSPNEASLDSQIQPGVYKLQAEQTLIGNDQYSHAVANENGYLFKNIHFLEGYSLHMEIKSDIVSENGYAEAKYSVSGQKLVVNIKQTTTTYYDKDSSLTFDSYNLVDENYTETVEMGSTSYTFEGPGLILRKNITDSQDLDKDDDTSEVVQVIEYYRYSEPN
ncbi:MAG: hypothetical protein WD016_09565 [Balneolaceae bacterium]